MFHKIIACIVASAHQIRYQHRTVQEGLGTTQLKLPSCTCHYGLFADSGLKKYPVTRVQRCIVGMVLKYPIEHINLPNSPPGILKS